MSLDALLEGTRSDYQSFDEYLAMIESLGSVPNLAVYCGHSSIRTWVMGADATRRTATNAEVAEMKNAHRIGTEKRSYRILHFNF